jgi:hypothetical protein
MVPAWNCWHPWGLRSPTTIWAIWPPRVATILGAAVLVGTVTRRPRRRGNDPRRGLRAGSPRRVGPAPRPTGTPGYSPQVRNSRMNRGIPLPYQSSQAHRRSRIPGRGNSQLAFQQTP